jgi:hypothetical protein
MPAIVTLGRRGCAQAPQSGAREEGRVYSQLASCSNSCNDSMVAHVPQSKSKFNLYDSRTEDTELLAIADKGVSFFGFCFFYSALFAFTMLNSRVIKRHNVKGSSVCVWSWHSVARWQGTQWTVVLFALLSLVLALGCPVRGGHGSGSSSGSEPLLTECSRRECRETKLELGHGVS